MNKNLLFVFLLFFSGFTNVFAQIANETVFGFLNIPASSRTAALGGDHVSLNKGGVDLFTTNPAYLDKSTHKQFAVSYRNHFSDIYFGTAGFSWHLEKYGTFAFGIRGVNYGDFTRVDREGIEQGSFSSYDFSWNAGFSRALTDNLQGGIGTKFITSRYDVYRSSAIAFFGGIFYNFNDDFTHIGLSFRNLGVQLTEFDETSEDLPFTILAGISHRLQHLPLRFNLTAHSLERWNIPVFDDEENPDIIENLFRHLRIGMEILFSENFNLRLGYDRLKNEELKSDRRIDPAGAAIGLGLFIRDIRIDISRTSYSETGGLIQIGLGASF